MQPLELASLGVGRALAVLDGRPLAVPAHRREATSAVPAELAVISIGSRSCSLRSRAARATASLRSASGERLQVGQETGVQAV